MKNFSILFTVLFASLFHAVQSQNLSPYIKVGVYNDNIITTYNVVQEALQNNGFDVIGNYNPEGKSNLKVLVLTRSDLQQTVLKVKDRGALAAVMKVGLKSSGNGTIITYVNPEYIFNAYLRNEYPKYESSLASFVSDLSEVLSAFGNENKELGGSVSVTELRKYQYKALMPNFDNPIVLKTFTSFEEGMQTIEKNLINRKGNTKLVYKLAFKNSKVAVYGVGLLNNSKGENKFLPIIGEDHIAALPYEIILQDKTATMLHGRFRIALHWPDLTMGTFMKIMSTPGNIEDFLKALCE